MCSKSLLILCLKTEPTSGSTIIISITFFCNLKHLPMHTIPAAPLTPNSTVCLWDICVCIMCKVFQQKSVWVIARDVCQQVEQLELIILHYCSSSNNWRRAQRFVVSRAQGSETRTWRPPSKSNILLSEGVSWWEPHSLILEFEYLDHLILIQLRAVLGRWWKAPKGHCGLKPSALWGERLRWWEGSRGCEGSIK